MSFPDLKYTDAAQFADAYFDRMKDAAASIDRQSIIDAAALLAEAYGGDATVYTCGNGHSSAIADAFASDHIKLCQTDTDLRPRVQSLAANMPMLTSLANDISYDDVFVYQLRTAARPGDILITISSSGNSENVVRAALWAKENGLKVIALSGFGGGRSKELADVSLHVTGDNYGVVEDTHQSLVHVLAQYIRLEKMDASLITERAF